MVVSVDGPGFGKHILASVNKSIIYAPAKRFNILTYVVEVNKNDHGHDITIIISQHISKSFIINYNKFLMRAYTSYLVYVYIWVYS